jgi:hypothetical protein
LRARRQENPDHREYLFAWQQLLGGDLDIDCPNDAGEHRQCPVISAKLPGWIVVRGF